MRRSAASSAGLTAPANGTAQPFSTIMATIGRDRRCSACCSRVRECPCHRHRATASLHAPLHSLFEGFTGAFDDADTVIICADVYSAGEAPIAGADRNSLVAALKARGHGHVLGLNRPQDLPALIRSVANPRAITLSSLARAISPNGHTRCRASSRRKPCSMPLSPRKESAVILPDIAPTLAAQMPIITPESLASHAPMAGFALFRTGGPRAGTVRAGRRKRSPIFWPGGGKRFRFYRSARAPDVLGHDGGQSRAS